MNYSIVRIRIENFNKWKPVYDDGQPGRKAAGLKNLHLWRNLDNPNEIVLLFEVSDIAKAKKFTTSPDLKEEMQKAGVLGPPDIVFLSDK